MKKILLISTGLRSLFCRLEEKGNNRWRTRRVHGGQREQGKIGDCFDLVALAGLLPFGLGLGVAPAMAANNGVVARHNNFYIRPAIETIFTNNQFNLDNKMGIGLGGWLFAGYHYRLSNQANALGNIDFEFGVGAFAPRLDKPNGVETLVPVGGVIGDRRKMTVKSNVIPSSFINGPTQATNRSDAGLVVTNLAGNINLMVSGGITQSVVANSFATELLDGNAAAFATATGKIIGVSSSTVVNDFAAAGVSALRIIVGPTTTTPILGISQLQGLSNAIQSPAVGGVDIPIGQNTDGNKLFVIDVNSPGSITLSDVVAGQSQGSYIFGDIFHYQPIVGHLSGAPTLLVNIVASQQATADNNDAVMVSTQTQTRTRTIDQTTHFNVLETIDINAQLDKTEMTASRHTSEIITTAYDQLIATTTLSRTIVDSKEIYVPITLGVNYSLTLGRSDFGFIVGVDAGAWLHNISRQYYFSGGGGQIMGFTETAIKNYNESKNIYHYNMTTAAVTVNQKITEIKNSFKSYDRATLITSNLGTMSLVGDIGLNSTASFIYNSSNNTLLLGLLGVNNAADLNGRLAVRTTTDMNNNGTISTGVGISLLHDLGFTTASQTGVLSHVKLIFADGNTPTITIVHGTTASSISQQSWTRTSNFVATVSATSTLGTITMNAITSSMVEGVAGVSAVVSANITVAAGNAITTLLGTAVTIANGSFTTETAVVRTLLSSNTSVVSAVSDIAVVESGVVKMDQATQVKGVIIPKVAFNWSPLDNLTFSLGGKLYIVIGGYSDYYSDAAKAEAETRGIGYKKDELLWYGGLEFGAQITF